MAIGQLVQLGSNVTTNSSSSISITVPNDGSVVVGDLLIWVSVMASGSRTNAVSGISGYTSLGLQAVSGHSSEVWYKLAVSGDLGATITVTPSTGSIRQVMLLGKVSGVNQTNPLGSPTKYGGGATLTGSTTKTTPTVTTVAAGSREISIVADSRGTSTPQTAAWTAPSGETKRGEAFAAGTTQLCSGGWGDSDATVSGSVGARAWTADQSAVGSYHTLAVATGAIIDALGTASQTATAQALPGRKTRPLGTASESDSARTLAQGHVTALGTSTEQDTTLALTGRKARVLGSPAAETATAQALARKKTRTLGVATQTAAAQPLIIGNGAAPDPAGETDTARAFTGAKSITLTPANMTVTAGVLGPGFGGTPRHRTYRVPAEIRAYTVSPR